MTITPNMTLELPVVGVTRGPAWATMLNTVFGVVDTHDHALGNGVRITPLGMNINADLDIESNNLNTVRSVRFANSTSVAGVSDVRNIYVKNDDLWYNTQDGTAVQITSGGNLNTGAIVTNVFKTQSITVNTVISASDTFTYLLVNTSTAKSITLPAASGVTPGRYFLIKDITGLSETNVISLIPNGTNQIDGVNATVSLSGNYGSWIIVSDGTSKWYLFDSSRTLNRAKVPAAGALTTGNVLQVNGTSSLTYAPLNLAGGSNFVSGVLPAANHPSATTGALGLIELATDLGGTATAPTVIELTGTGTGGVTKIKSGTLSFANSLTGVTFNQTAPASGIGHSLIVQAQSSGTVGSAGGSLLLRSGSDNSTGANNGQIILQLGTTDWLTLDATLGLVPQTSIQLSSAIASPKLIQIAATSGAGQQLQISAQDAFSGAGGTLLLTGGARTSTSAKGGIVIKMNGASGDTMLTMTEVANGQKILSLCGTVTSSNVGANGGDGVIFIKNAATVPLRNANPSGGGLLYASGQRFGWVGVNTGSIIEFDGETSTVAGLQSPNYWMVKIDGTTYKVPLFANS